MGPLLPLFLGVEENFLHFNGGDAACEGAAVDRGGGPPMALHGKGILVFTGHVEIFGHRFSCQAHAPVPLGVVLGHAGVGHNAPSAERDGGHRFNAAGHNAVRNAGVDLGRRDGDGFQSAGAVTVDRHARHFVRVQAHE